MKTSIATVYKVQGFCMHTTLTYTHTATEAKYAQTDKTDTEAFTKLNGHC